MARARSILKFAVLAILIAVSIRLGVSVARAVGQTINLTVFSFPYNHPIGIDYYQPLNQLLMSVNYFTGLPNNLDLIDANGQRAPFGNLAGLIDEMKISTVKDSACTGGFSVGDTFIGNGVPGQIALIRNGVLMANPWVTLPGEKAHIRGSMYQDRHCAVGGDLIVATGISQPAWQVENNGYMGKVWRVSCGPVAGCTAPVATLVVDLQKHLEGVVTVPNNPLRYGPLAGRIVVGDEDRTFGPHGVCGRLFAIRPTVPGGLPLDIFTISDAASRTATLDGSCVASGADKISYAAYPNYLSSHPIHPEDLDWIPKPDPNPGVNGDGQFFGVDYGGGRVLTAPITDFNNLCGDLLITREYPNDGFFAGTSGLSSMSWNPNTSSFDITVLETPAGFTASQWEHVTFRGGLLCNHPAQLKVVKTPDNGTFTPGSVITFTIEVSNPAGADASWATHVYVTDKLPTNGGLVWDTATTTQPINPPQIPPASCVSPIVNNTLDCYLHDIGPGEKAIITVKSKPTPPSACQLQPNSAVDPVTGLAGAVAFEEDPAGLKASDVGSVTCESRSITIKKYTNGADADDPNGADVPNIAPGGLVTWRYDVKLVTGSGVPKADVVVTDDHGGVTPVYSSGDDGDNLLEVGETWIYQATGFAANLATVPLDNGKIVDGVCKHNNTEPARRGYVNEGKVTIPGNISATDKSAYCNPPPPPTITIKKYTNGADADDPNGADVPNILPGGLVTWRYDVKLVSGSGVPKADVLVTDDHGGVTPVYVSGDDGDNLLEVGETWIYQATGFAANLSLTPLDNGKIVDGVCKHNNTEPPRRGYVNTGKVTIPGNVSATDKSAYCNLPTPPTVTIKKYTNGADADDPDGADVPNVLPGGAVTWRYDVKLLSGSGVAKADVVVTDDHGGVTPVYVSGDNGNNLLEVGETWIYQATGFAANLSLTPLDNGKIVDGVCKHNNTEAPRRGYVNTGKVTIPGNISATDKSAYCNPPVTVTPRLKIIKFTNGADANNPDGADVPNISVNGTVTWTYHVSVTDASVARISLLVSDSAGFNASEVLKLNGKVDGDNNNDDVLQPGETWLYSKTGVALDLTLPQSPPVTTVADVCTHGGLEPKRTAYKNTGTVTAGALTASDDSSYCNPPPPTITPCPAGSFTFSMLPNGDLFIKFEQFPAPNDNSYGINAVWGTKSHSFSNLTGSDKAGFQLVNPSNSVKLDFDIDYLSAKSGTPSGFASLGPFGGDGDVNVGTLTVADILWDTSLAANLNSTGYFVGGTQLIGTSGTNSTSLLVNSPATLDRISNYTLKTPNPWTKTVTHLDGTTVPSWDFRNTYRVIIKKAKLQSLGYLDGSGNPVAGWKVQPNINALHNSPAKACPPGPTPPTPFVCTKPITSMTVQWNGTQTPVWVKAWNGSIGTGTPTVFGPIAIGQNVTFTRGTSSTPNDIFFEVFNASSMAPATKIGNSTFHLSCSDSEMNSSDDCNKPAGDGKGQTAGLLNTWIFKGMSGGGKTLTCTP